MLRFAGTVAAVAAADSTDAPKVNEGVGGSSTGTDAATPER